VPSLHPSMRDLYERLEQAGIDRTFVQNAILPPWWRDHLADVPANRQLAELYLAQNLSLDLQDLHARDHELQLPLRSARFKRSEASDLEKSRPTAFLAQQAGEILAEFIDHIPPYDPPKSPLEIRQWIFWNGYRQVDLPSLLHYCWAHGIIVFHLGTVARKSHRLDGMVMFSGDRPVIMLGSRRRFSSWLAFHLAHEVAHLLRRHVKPGDDLLVDDSLETSPGKDPVEVEANRYAFTILTKDPEPDLGLPASTPPANLYLKAEPVAREWKVDPGVLILIHAQKHAAWAEAARSLQYHFGEDGESAKEIIDRELWSRIKDADLPETSRRFLHAVIAS
jgi:Zn-dependent peptidase ImmA (M78 family)